MATDYNSGGFYTNSNGTIFGRPDPAAPGSAADYDIWDWKQIQAAILGLAGSAGPADWALARAAADPVSLQKAANAYFTVQHTFEGIAQSVLDQAKALAGENGPWKGAASDSFLAMMTTFSKQIQANADVLSGGSTGDHSVPHQLANNAAALERAQFLIGDINEWYAQQAVNLGVRPMSNGLIPVSQNAQIVALMNETMRTVLKNLAHNYQVTAEKIISPAAVTSPTSGNEAPSPGGGGPGGGSPEIGTPQTSAAIPVACRTRTISRPLPVALTYLASAWTAASAAASATCRAWTRPTPQSPSPAACPT